MPVTAIVEAWEERTGQHQLSGVKTFTRFFKVTMENPEDPVNDIFGSFDQATGVGVPAIGDPHPDVQFATCSNVSIRGTASRVEWRVTVEYATDVAQTYRSRNRHPWNEDAVVSIGNKSIERVALVNKAYDEDGDELAWMAGDYPSNSAKDVLPDVMEDFLHWDVKIRMNLRTWDWSLYENYIGTVNNAQITVVGLTIPARYGKIVTITSPGLTNKNGDDYFPVDFALEIIPSNSIVEPYGWVQKILDVGYLCQSLPAYAGKQIQAFTGSSKPEKPAYLNGYDGRISTEPHYIRILVEDETDWSALGLPTAMPTRTV